MINKIIYVIISLCSLGTWAKAEEVTPILRLTENWMFAEAGTSNWRTAIVPGTVHQDLLCHQLLPDPFYGTNEKDIQWVETKNWEYKTTFVVPDSLLHYDEARLNFEGLDTYADVYLNGALLLKADNMFIGYTIPVKQILRKGENHLHILFHSPITSILPQWESNGFNYPADNDHHDKHLSIFSRKAPYSFGWDWGIRMVTSGIWRPVTLSFHQTATIEDFHVRQLSVTKEKAQLINMIELSSISDEALNAKLVLSYQINAMKETKITHPILLKKGSNSIEIPLEISQPELWMPNGWGKANLYNFKAQILCNDSLISEKKLRIGLRSIKVVNEKDDHGESFYFEINGIPLFAKGANYIPSDALLPSVTKERYDRLFKDIKESHMNMIRIWGGGTYEDDYFYQMADENGILIWQDFMFACTPYPHDSTFLKRVEKELDYNIKRLRNHVCLALWCGNNEIIEGLTYWGWQNQYSPEIYSDMQKGYELLFKKLIPSKIKELDPEHFYIHSSPYYSQWENSQTLRIGDSHYWGVWHGQQPFSIFNTKVPRFMSEFGFQSFPEMKTIETFASPQDYNIESEVMNSHQKSSIGNKSIKTYMERDYIIPDKFEDFVYTSLLLQGKGMRIGLEAHRRNKPLCMGTLYWQLNDSWPVVSWSSIDYYGNWKALHYQVKRAFAPLLISPVIEETDLCYYLISDRLDTLEQAILEIEQIDFSGKIIRKKTVRTNLPANQVVMAAKEPMNIFSPEEKKSSFLLLTLKDKKGEILNNITFFLTAPKNLNLPETIISHKVKQYDGFCEVTLFSKKLAKDVFIEVPVQGARFTDNFFDLLPGQKRKIIIKSPSISKDKNMKIKIKQLRDTYL